MVTRFFDIVFSIFGLMIFLPLFLFISVWIVIDSRGGIFYLQDRVGKGNRTFRLIKFRTMRVHADQMGSLTVGVRDNRITRAGFWLRQYKLDELPQLINVVLGDMSLVGPRPEIRKYVDLYDVNQKKVLTVKPGITDYASIEYINESMILGKSSDPEKTYIEVVMPAKIELNMNYINNPNVGNYFVILIKTISRIIKG